LVKDNKIKLKNHNYFLLIDDGKDKAGVEEDFRFGLSFGISL